MTYLLAILLGAVQGLTEFLPISSTGHLLILENIFRIDQASFGLAFDASLHLGTLIAISIFFYKDYVKVFTLKNQLWLKLTIGTTPAVILGLIFENQIETVLRQTWIVATALIVFSFVFIFAEKKGQKTKTQDKLTLKDTLIIGFFQALALIPGISRSGSTISAGLLLNFKREEAARFAFMLSGPVVAGAGLKKFLGVVGNSHFNSTDLNFFLIGIFTSAIFGYLTIKYLIKYLTTQSLYPFVIYRVTVGLILLFASLLT